MITRFVLAMSAIVLLALPGLAQNLFAPVVRVDDSVITGFEVEQRLRFLQVLNAAGASRDSVIETLVEDRLKLREARGRGLSLPEEGLRAEMTEFAGRANLSLEKFTSELGKVGIAPETFRDFVAVNVLWRDLIRGLYGNRVQITEREIDRALASGSNSGGIRVLMSEVIIPAPPQNLATAQRQAEQVAQSKSEAEFSSFARRFSATSSRQAGGRLPWTPVNRLPPNLRAIVLGLAPGEVTPPLPLQNAIAIFQLRAIEETESGGEDYAAIEYAAYYINGGRTEAALSQAAKIRAEVDECDDLYGIAQGQPEEVLERGALPPEEIPEDIALELSKLDPGEVSTNLTRADGQTLVFLMLCGRTTVVPEEVDREAVAQRLRSQRLNGFADSLIGDLKSQATIVRLQ